MQKTHVQQELKSKCKITKFHTYRPQSSKTLVFINISRWSIFLGEDFSPIFVGDIALPEKSVKNRVQHPEKTQNNKKVF